MQTATTKQVRKIVSNYFNGNTFTGNSWTDVVRGGYSGGAGDDGMRRVAFKICGGSMAKNKLEQIRVDLQALFTLAGFANTVKVTDSTNKRVGLLAYCRDDSGCYVRVKARLA
jgi:hypothetical protein